MRGLGAFSASVFAIAIPSIYFTISIIAMQQTLRVEANVLARSIGSIIQARPDLWEFESIRLKRLLSDPLVHGERHEAEIFTAAGKLVEKTDFREIRPILSASAQFFDSGRLAGWVSIRHTIRPHVITTALLAILSSLFGYLTYYIFRTYPIKKLENTLMDLHRARDELEKRVADRTQSLQHINEDLKSVQTQLIQSAKLASIGELAAGVAHELNQPLMIIRTTAQLMLRKKNKSTLGDVKLLDGLNSIERNTKRMMNIINHLRTFSRQIKGEFMPVDINKILQDSFLMIGEQLSLRNIEVTKNLSSDLPKVLADANQLEQVFLNMLTNARDAIESNVDAKQADAEPQKKIVITTQVPDDAKDKVEILFKDTGGGISREVLKNIFDPFYTTKEVGKGTGLGLSISYGIIQNHKGEIDTAETGPEGTTFRITLPVADM